MNEHNYPLSWPQTFIVVVVCIALAVFLPEIVRLLQAVFA